MRGFYEHINDPLRFIIREILLFSLELLRFFTCVLAAT